MIVLKKITLSLFCSAIGFILIPAFTTVQYSKAFFDLMFSIWYILPIYAVVIIVSVAALNRMHISILEAENLSIKKFLITFMAVLGIEWFILPDSYETGIEHISFPQFAMVYLVGAFMWEALKEKNN